MESAAPKKCRPARRSSRYAVPSLGGADYSGLHEARFVTLRAAVTAHDRSMAMRRRRRAGGKITGCCRRRRRGATRRQPAMVNLAARRCDSMSPDRSDGMAWRGVACFAIKRASSYYSSRCTTPNSR